jgi:hypothetical protein
MHQDDIPSELKVLLERIAKPDRQSAVKRWIFNLSYTASLKGRFDDALAKNSALSSSPTEAFHQLQSLANKVHTVNKSIQQLPYEVEAALTEEMPPDRIKDISPILEALEMAISKAAGSVNKELAAAEKDPSELEADASSSAGRKRNFYAFALAAEAADAFTHLSGKTVTLEREDAKGNREVVATKDFTDFVVAVFGLFDVKSAKYFAKEVAQTRGKEFP